MERPAWDRPLVTAKDGKRRNIPVLDYELAGETFYLVMDEGHEAVVSFPSGETLLYAEHGEALTPYPYKAQRANEFVWFVHFMRTDRTCFSLVIDRKNQLVTALEATVGYYPKRPTVVHHTYHFGAIKLPGEDLPVMRHGFTDELAGKRIAWRYSTEVVITHIYKTAYSIRSSLANMQPLSDEATPEQREEVANRAARWGATFFEEPARYVKINDGLYLMAFIEENRNRVNAPEGGGDMVLLIDTVRVHDVGRTYGAHPDGTGNMGLITAHGKFVDNDDPMLDADSPYWV